VIIDVHTHFLPRAVVAATSFGTEGEPYAVTIADGDVLFRGEGISAGFELDQLVDPARRLRDMAAAGVDSQVLSVPPPFGFFYDEQPEPALRLSRQLNDRLADVVAAHPGRFRAMATVPLQAPQLAAREVTRAVRERGLSGVEIASRVGAKNLDDPGLASFYAAVQELGVPVFVHSTRGLGADRLRDYHLGNLIGNPTEDAIAAASLIFGGVLDAFPALKVYLAHGGGSCPFLVGRWDRGWRVRPEARARLHSPPSSYLRRLRFDSLTHDPGALHHLLGVAGVRGVMLGTDYPYDMGEPEPLAAVGAVPGLDPGERALVLGGNAEEFFDPSS
jgi:aminocarboxymuconate-semialdehyde decarboxylase